MDDHRTFPGNDDFVRISGILGQGSRCEECNESLAPIEEKPSCCVPHDCLEEDLCGQLEDAGLAGRATGGWSEEVAQGCEARPGEVVLSGPKRDKVYTVR